MTRSTGHYETTVTGGESVRAFVPDPLPPKDPPLNLDAISDRLRTAEKAALRLDLAGEMVPSVDWFIYAFVRKEAVVSSQIEGTQATLEDLLLYEARPSETDEPSPDVGEICNYLDAIQWARGQMAAPFAPPLSMRLLCGAHERLLQGTRGASRSPGEIRRSQNWIGGTRPGNAVFVPPPPHMLPAALSALEKYIHAEDPLLPSLVRAGLVHVQFETIHPFLDGNGRIGRLLVSLLLEHWGLLRRPLLYLSLFFKRHRAEYYRRLDHVRTHGDWESWLDFFLDGVATIAEEAVDTSRHLFSLVATDRQHLLARGSVSVASLRLFELLPRNPVVNSSSVIHLLGTTRPAAGRALDVLVRAGILVETTGRRRDRSYAYDRYITLLKEGTDLEDR